MKSWLDVVTHPLGLSAFALFLFFSFLGARTVQSATPARNKTPWSAAALFVLALVALVGGLYLASVQLGVQHPSSPPSRSVDVGDVKQETQGAGEVVGVRAPADGASTSIAVKSISQAASAASSIVGVDLTAPASSAPAR